MPTCSLLMNFQKAVCITFLMLTFLSSKETSCRDKNVRGELCQYMCHCQGGAAECQDDGTCLGECEDGYMGPKCQHIVIATWQAENLSIHNTSAQCSPELGKVVLNFDPARVFLWMRVWTKPMDADDTGETQREVQILADGEFLPCTLPQLIKMSKYILDILCLYVQEPISTVEIKGEMVKSWCQIKVSGGRNFALNQKAKHSSSSNSESGMEHPAGLSVDGSLDDSSCSFTVPHIQNSPGEWLLELRHPIDVYQITVKAKPDRPEQLSGLRVKLLIEGDTVLYEHASDGEKSDVLRIFPPRVMLGVTQVQLSRNEALTFCELELYGECPRGRFDDCDVSVNCNCAQEWETCSILTGRCPSGCGVGYSGDTCSRGCPVGRYGEQCKETCSSYCTDTNCDTQTGHCLLGCSDPNAIPPLCTLSESSALEILKTYSFLVVASVLSAMGFSFFLFRKIRSSRTNHEETETSTASGAHIGGLSVKPSQDQFSDDDSDDDSFTEGSPPIPADGAVEYSSDDASAVTVTRLTSRLSSNMSTASLQSQR